MYHGSARWIVQECHAANSGLKSILFGCVYTDWACRVPD
jgi:hypothetical protein